jgi:hypothetical protein
MVSSQKDILSIGYVYSKHLVLQIHKVHSLGPLDHEDGSSTILLNVSVSYSAQGNVLEELNLLQHRSENLNIPTSPPAMFYCSEPSDG